MIKFNIGDEVICTDYGNGIVVGINTNSLFPINVHFEDQDKDDYVEYTSDGRSVLKSPITLSKIITNNII
jgi:hypothetical protein